MGIYIFFLLMMYQIDFEFHFYPYITRPVQFWLLRQRSATQDGVEIDGVSSFFSDNTHNFVIRFSRKPLNVEWWLTAHFEGIYTHRDVTKPDFFHFGVVGTLRAPKWSGHKLFPEKTTYHRYLVGGLFSRYLHTMLNEQK